MSGAPTLRIRGARTHNLRDLDVDLPLGAWTVVVGVSGSGKSSLVLDTLGAESRRRFLGVLGRTREGLELVPRPDVDRIDHLPPAVLLGAGERAPGPLETVGTLLEASHALRALYARAATPHCPACGDPLAVLPRTRILAALTALPAGTRLYVLVRVGRGPAGLAAATKGGYVRVRVAEGPLLRLEDLPAGPVDGAATVDVVLDRLVAGPGLEERLRDTLDHALALGGGVLRVRREPREGAAEELTFAVRPWCGRCDAGQPALTAQRFAHTHPDGACAPCRGRGLVEAAAPRPARRPVRREARREARRAAATAPPVLVPCPACAGTRLAPYPRGARLQGRTLPEAEALPAAELAAWLAALEGEGLLSAQAAPLLDDLRARLAFLADLGLADLALARAAEHLSRGELRRLRVAATCAGRMSGLLYVLDEPLSGCHPDEREAVRRRLRALVDEGGTVVSVEHDLAAVRAADHVLELGPGAGREGGALVAAGPPVRVAAGATALAEALRRPLPAPREAPRFPEAWARLTGARARHLADLAVRFPARGLTCVAGVSGAGKHTLVFEVLAPLLSDAPLAPGAAGRLEGRTLFGSVSASEGRAARHPRAMPLSLLKAFEPLREVFALTLEARTRGWGPARFALGAAGGRCEACRGSGEMLAALRDAPEMHVPCELCDGRRYAPDTEAVRVKGLSMADVLALTVAEAAGIFRDLPRVGPVLRAAAEVGLGYLPLGRPATRLSTGEVLRLRLAAALGRGGGAAALYLLDEPASGLHPDDVRHLLAVLERLVAAGHGVVAVEHDPLLIASADHLIVLGPGAGPRGGRLLYQGPPAGRPPPPRPPS